MTLVSKKIWVSEKEYSEKKYYLNWYLIYVEGHWIQFGQVLNFEKFNLLQLALYRLKPMGGGHFLSDPLYNHLTACLSYDPEKTMIIDDMALWLKKNLKYRVCLPNHRNVIAFESKKDFLLYKMVWL